MLWGLRRMVCWAGVSLLQPTCFNNESEILVFMINHIHFISSYIYIDYIYICCNNNN
ncbi:hypothetical protein POPTR_019G129150v4 [Populus trichocarpa]|uniref:Uncharacterized protein n=1 Tax=Populus trichocarpa TaxID=3694 RepID=A0ACC0RL57_POPTR|nr:hypothetical protein POPTR_019G129150v4 [Populus trichocarpa]